MDAILGEIGESWGSYPELTGWLLAWRVGCEMGGSRGEVDGMSWLGAYQVLSYPV